MKSEIPCKADELVHATFPVSRKDYSDMLQCSIDRVNEPIIFGITDLFSVCPKCHAPGPEIIQGKELRVKSLLVE